MRNSGNFFNYSSVTDFLKNLKAKGNADLIMDYDGRKHIRLMKRYYTDKVTSIEFQKSNKNRVELKKAIENHFYLRCYLPKDQLKRINSKASKVVIMINGMNELEHFDFYDRIGEFFAKNEMIAILLPTPLNLNRRIEKYYKKIRLNDSPEDEKPYPTYLAMNNPDLFHLSYLRTYFELNYLVQLIRGDEVDHRNNHFYQQLIQNKNCDISLFGYSLGGLKVLGYFMNDFVLPDKINTSVKVKEEFYNNKKTKYSSCITFNSGPFLKEANTKSLDIETLNWNKIINKVSSNFDLNQKKHLIENHPEEKDLIELNEFLYYNDFYFKGDKDRISTINTRIDTIRNNYLAISAGDDPIVKYDQIQKISTSKPINQIIVAEVDHHPTIERSRWHEVLPDVQQNILTFISSCVNGHYNKKSIVEEIFKIIKKLDCFENIMADQKLLGAEALVMIRKELEGKSEDFERYYYASKAFIADFSELLIYIKRKHYKSKP